MVVEQEIQEELEDQVVVLVDRIQDQVEEQVILHQLLHLKVFQEETNQLMVMEPEAVEQHQQDVVLLVTLVAVVMELEQLLIRHQE
jgi:hypothetical protein